MNEMAKDSLLDITPRPEGGPLHRFAHRALACVWEIYIAGRDADYARQATHAAFAEVNRLELELSRFVPHSDIARLNALAPGESTRVGIEACECLELAARVHAETGGAFDVTIGALLSPRPAGAAPDDRPVGMPLLQLHRPTRSVRVLAAGLIVDLGGLGKGYAVDQAVRVLRDWGITVALVHSGQSTVYALGSPSGQSGWSIALRHPVEAALALGEVRLRDAALSGSGVRVHGRHIFDPRTRRPVEGAEAAWALASSAALSDALSTAFMVMSPVEVGEYCRHHPEVSALACLAGESGAGPTLLCWGGAWDRPHAPSG